MTHVAPIDLDRRRLGLCALGLLAGLPRHARAAGTAWLPAPPLPPVALRDQDGRAFTPAQALAGARTAVVSFFFTGCQTVCPPQTALLREAQRRLQAEGRAAGLRLLAISVDPLGDGPAQLRDYARRFELPLAQPGAPDGWRLLTGEREPVARVLAAFGVLAAAPGEHPSLLWLADLPRGRWTRSSSLNPPETLVALLASLRA